MATRLRKWTIFAVYIWIYLFIFLDCMVYQVEGKSYSNSTQSTLCAAQCEALCLDGVSHCEDKCVGPKLWMADRDGPNCTSSCSALYLSHYQNRDQLLNVPHVVINRTGPDTIELSWNRPSPLSPRLTSSIYSTIYIVEETHQHPEIKGVQSISIKEWTRNTSVKLDLKNACYNDSYRVMAINQFGSMGFSIPVQIPGSFPAVHAPGLVQNISYSGNGVYYYVNKKDKTQARFMAILKWDPPAGWSESDISHYRWNPMVKRYCPQTTMDSLPLFTKMQNHSRHILMSIGNNSIGCNFTAQVQAVSKCNINGPWTDFSVDLSNCSAISGYKCYMDASDPPGKVEDLTINISSTPIAVLKQMFKDPYSLNQNTNSPLLINLHVRWKPPTDLGGLGEIDHYTIRSGIVVRNPEPDLQFLPPSFVGTPHEIRVSKNIHDLAFQIPTQNIPYLFGIQVLAVAPGQEIAETTWRVTDVHTLEVHRNESGIGQYLKEGKVLLDKAGIVIVYINNSLQLLFDPPVGHSDNSSVDIDRYAVQWGPLVTPDTMEVEKTTIISANQTVMTVTLLHSMRTYGIKVIYLMEEEKDPDLEEWENTPLMSFTVPRLGDTVEEIIDQLTPLYVTIGVVMSIILTALALKYLHHHHNFKHLEERLALTEEEVGEDGDHYFVMRLSDHVDDDIMDIPTVVADHWELPHSCLKMGRVLGSGAFGQVVKGRVSKSLLMHRGIDSHTTHSKKGTHVIVAIKMLQDNADERHLDNFLKEIDMMKDIGYHRNIVSILGCCTLRQPYCLVVEHMPHGDLLAYFRNIRQKMQQKEVQNEGYINQDIDMFSPRDLLSVARQITTGMDFLSQKGFVHRDLAARNILVGNDKTVKIGDFGLARYIYHEVNKIYVTRRGGKLPLRWMSPEAIFDMTFSAASDVWSFGIVLYEIVTLGGSPYPALSNVELLQALKHGHRMSKPDNCSQEIYDIMLNCWKEQPHDRPSFSQLCHTFTTLLEEDSYLEYFNFNVPLSHDYYRINSDAMDEEIFDLDDQGIPINLDKLPGASQDMQEVTAHKSKVTTEIPDHDCIIKEMTKAERNDDTMSYTDSPFLARIGTTSSFNNGLYPAMECEQVDNDHTEENINCNITNKLQTKPDEMLDQTGDENAPENTDVVDTESTKPVVEKRASASSDDVFTNCPGCTMLANDTNYRAESHADPHQLTNTSIDSDFSQCPDCGRLDLHLTAFDIHVNERNDSAICSTASDDSDQSHSNQSDSSMAISEVYLMPDSPSAEDSDYGSGKKDNDMNSFNFDLSDNFHNHSNNISKDAKQRLKYFENPCYPELNTKFTDESIWNARGDMLKQKYLDGFLVSQSRYGDIWSIAETKF